MDNISRKGDVADRSAEEEEASVRCARDAAFERIGDVDFRWERVTGPAPD